jgi:hypothetical protein
MHGEDLFVQKPLQRLILVEGQDNLTVIFTTGWAGMEEFACTSATRVNTHAM